MPERQVAGFFKCRKYFDTASIQPMTHRFQSADILPVPFVKTAMDQQAYPMKARQPTGIAAHQVGSVLAIERLGLGIVEHHTIPGPGHQLISPPVMGGNSHISSGFAQQFAGGMIEDHSEISWVRPQYSAGTCSAIPCNHISAVSSLSSVQISS